jgi:hypothetical protein
VPWRAAAMLEKLRDYHRSVLETLED